MKQKLYAAAAAIVCLGLGGCAAAQSAPETVPAPRQMPAESTALPEKAQEQALAGGEIRLPLMLRAPQTDDTLSTLLSGDVLGGAFTTVRSCCTRDLRTDGTLTVRVAALPDAGREACAAFALWKLAGDQSQYCESVGFACDGNAQYHVFSGLAPDALYRVVFSCTDPAVQRISGVFAVEGVTAEIREEENTSSGEKGVLPEHQ